MSAPGPRLVSVNVGAPRETVWRGRLVRSAICKDPVGDRAVAIRRLNLAGDDQADRTVHGGSDKAVYAYATEDYRYWTDHEGVQTTPGLFGENLTVQGLDLRMALVGERWHVGSTVLQVTQPRLPCFKLGMRMNDPGFLRRFLSVGRLGAYLRVIEEGPVRAGDAIAVSDRRAQAATLQEMARSLLRGERAPSRP
jgi:MOSC domain-containing protein YiiM